MLLEKIKPDSHYFVACCVTALFGSNIARTTNPKTLKIRARRKPNQPGYPFFTAISMPHDKIPTIVAVMIAKKKPDSRDNGKSRPFE
jgi:hypothetical protein